jgi:hypothetical protein
LIEMSVDGRRSFGRPLPPYAFGAMVRDDGIWSGHS